MSKYASLIDQYLAGPEQLRQVIARMTDEQINAAPIPGKWSTRQVICHIADFEPVYADRMKRAIAVSEPTFFGAEPDLFAFDAAHCTTSPTLDPRRAVPSGAGMETPSEAKSTSSV
jgi:hypothetical protein